MADYKEAVSALPPLRDVIHTHDLRAEKKFGQNFLLDLNLTDKIVRAAGNLKDCHVIEIGPGPGGLTRSLLQSDSRHVTAIEYDPRAVRALQDLNSAAQGHLTLVQGDALDVDLKSLYDAPRAIVANLPYNIATPLFLKWLQDLREDYQAYRSMTLMFQKEVAERIAAPLGHKAYGRLGVMAQWLCDTQIAFDVPASAFTPPPKVTSSIIYCQPKKLDDDAPQFKTMEHLVGLAFGQRRKMIRSSLKDYTQHFDKVGLDETLRAENLSVENFIALAKAVEKDRL